LKTKIAFIILTSLLFSGCYRTPKPPYIPPVKTEETGMLTVYHASPSMTWRTNANIIVNNKWFDGLLGGDYKQELVPVGDLNLTIGMNNDQSTMRSQIIKITKGMHVCISVNPEVDGFYWFDNHNTALSVDLDINEMNVSSRRVDEETCKKAIAIRKRD